MKTKSRPLMIRIGNSDLTYVSLWRCTGCKHTAYGKGRFCANCGRRFRKVVNRLQRKSRPKTTKARGTGSVPTDIYILGRLTPSSDWQVGYRVWRSVNNEGAAKRLLAFLRDGNGWDLQLKPALLTESQVKGYGILGLSIKNLYL